tara:strand:+ start:1875 stop:2663 length:789 start_codon:yes stop_codon:yes gene_type:complete
MIFIQPLIDPVIISLGPLDIRWYSMAYIIAFFLGLYLIKLINNKIKSNITNNKLDDFLIWSIIGVIIGGRLGYVIFYQLENFFQNPLYLIYIWKGGMSFHGGLIGMIFSIFLFTKKNNLNFFLLSDYISLVAPIGLFFGRLANFINVELIGRVTEFPIAMIYPTIDDLPRHPSQLYEAFFEGIVLFLILLSIILKNYSNKNYGYISGLFLLIYGVFRFLIEFTREPDAHIGLVNNIFSMGQILCIPLIFFGILLIIKKRRNE